MRERASQCRRLAAITHDQRMVGQLLKWAAEIEADIERLSNPTLQDRERP
jgi:hypothetical protein